MGAETHFPCEKYGEIANQVLCPIAKGAATFPDRAAFIETGEGSNTELLSITSYARLESTVTYLTSFFQEQGITTGNKVAILSNNSAVFVATLFALHRLGATAILLSLQLTTEDWRAQLELAEVRLLLGEQQFLDRLGKTSPPQVSLESLIDKSKQADTHSINATSPAPSPVNLSFGREAIVVFTSSVTGHKKGVILSLANFFSSASASNAITKLSAADCWGVSLPLYHVGGLGIIYRTLLAGATSIFLPKFSSETIIPLLRKNLLSHLSCVPTVLESLLDAASSAKTEGTETLLAPLKAIILAGAPSSESLIEKIKSTRAPVLSAWGMTETTAHGTCMSLNDPLSQITTVGRPFPHTSITIVNEQGEALPHGERGEILVKGPTVCMGYLGSEIPQPKVIDGWLHTGDIGVLDKENYLTIVGRIDDMFISGGENIHAGEIEAIALKHPLVRHAAVIPVPHPKWGKRPVMYVELSGEVGVQDLLDFLKQRLAKIKVPDQIFPLEELPRTAIGKVDYKALKKLRATDLLQASNQKIGL